MKTELIDIDSQLWGRSVLNISEFTPCDDFGVHEAEYLARYAPAYVSTAVDVSDLARIDYLGKAGFIPVDCQLVLRASFRRQFDTSSYNMTYRRVDTSDQLDEVLGIAAELDFNDRFSRDSFAPPGFSQKRYAAYLRQSFVSASDEIWSVCDSHSGRMLTFRSHRRISNSDVRLLLGGVRRELHGEGLGAISTHFCFNQMAASGIKRGTTQISIANKPIFDLEVTHFGFRYHSASLIFRKCYPPSHTGEQT